MFKVVFDFEVLNYYDKLGVGMVIISQVDFD